MSCAEHLRDLLRPLGVYRLDAPFVGGELDVQGEALDGVEAALEEVRRETDLTGAEDWGLDRLAGLFARRPVAGSPRPLAAALAALLRISGDSFTLEAISDTLSGCGVAARVEETGVGQVSVSFPGVPGVPAGFGQMLRIIEDILPSHLDIQYHFWYLVWRELEGKFSTWSAIEAQGMSWTGLETCVE